jgi:hypothetical protein
VSGFDPEGASHLIWQREIALHQKIMAFELNHGMTVIDLLDHPSFQDFSQREERGIFSGGKFNPYGLRQKKGRWRMDLVQCDRFATLLLPRA